MGIPWLSGIKNQKKLFSGVIKKKKKSNIHPFSYRLCTNDHKRSHPQQADCHNKQTTQYPSAYICCSFIILQMTDSLPCQTSHSATQFHNTHTANNRWIIDKQQIVSSMNEDMQMVTYEIQWDWHAQSLIKQDWQFSMSREILTRLRRRTMHKLTRFKRDHKWLQEILHVLTEWEMLRHFLILRWFFWSISYPDRVPPQERPCTQRLGFFNTFL